MKRMLDKSVILARVAKKRELRNCPFVEQLLHTYQSCQSFAEKQPPPRREGKGAKYWSLMTATFPMRTMMASLNGLRRGLDPGPKTKAVLKAKSFFLYYCPLFHITEQRPPEKQKNKACMTGRE